MLQSSRLEDHMKTIGIDQSSFAKSSFEHRCMNNIKKIYQHAGKCDDQQKLKDIIYADIQSTPEGVTDNIPNVHMKSTTTKKPSARKSLCLFTNILAVVGLIFNTFVNKHSDLLALGFLTSFDVI